MSQRFMTMYHRLRADVRPFADDRSGSVAMEYSLVGTLVSVAIVAALTSTTDGVAAKWSGVVDQVLAVLR